MCRCSIQAFVFVSFSPSRSHFFRRSSQWNDDEWMPPLHSVCCTQKSFNSTYIWWLIAFSESFDCHIYLTTDNWPTWIVWHPFFSPEFKCHRQNDWTAIWTVLIWESHTNHICSRWFGGCQYWDRQKCISLEIMSEWIILGMSVCWCMRCWWLFDIVSANKIFEIFILIQKCCQSVTYITRKIWPTIECLLELVNDVVYIIFTS